MFSPEEVLVGYIWKMQERRSEIVAKHNGYVNIWMCCCPLSSRVCFMAGAQRDRCCC